MFGDFCKSQLWQIEVHYQGSWQVLQFMTVESQFTSIATAVVAHKRIWGCVLDLTGHRLLWFDYVPPVFMCWKLNPQSYMLLVLERWDI